MSALSAATKLVSARDDLRNASKRIAAAIQLSGSEAAKLSLAREHTNAALTILDNEDRTTSTPEHELAAAITARLIRDLERSTLNEMHPEAVVMLKQFAMDILLSVSDEIARVEGKI